MSTEEDKQLIRRYQEAYNHNNLAALNEIVNTNLISHNQMPGLPPGLEGGNLAHGMAVGAFPDLHTQIEDLIGEGDKVVARFVMTGTHQGEFMGIAPTGTKIRVTGISIFRIANGKIAEHWGEEDALGWLQQLGAIPKPGL